MPAVHLLNEMSGKIELQIQACAEVRHGSAWREQGSKPFYDLWLVTGGTVALQTETACHTLRCGDLFWLNPGVFYTAHGGGQACSFVYIQFEAYYMHKPRFFDALSTEGFFGKQQIEQEAKLLADAVRQFKTQALFSPLTLKSALMLLVGKLAALYTQQNPARAARIEYTYAGLERVLHHIDTHLAEPLHVGQLAEQMCMTEKYFITYFKAKIGLTPHRYIIEKRLRRAYALLMHTRCSVKEAAELVGYTDPYGFSKAFKARYGFSPSKL